MEINGVAFKEPTGGDTNATQSLAQTFDTFLSLLTTQLQNQDPLDPMKSEEFTQQLVQFTGVEQAINTNKKLDQLIQINSGNQINGLVSFIGNTVEVTSDQLALTDGAATITYDLDSNAANTTVSIVDQTGRTVRTLSAETAAGKHRLVWDGLSASGAQLPDGIYNFSIAAVDADNATVPVVAGTQGRVTGIEVLDDGIHFNLGPLSVPASSVVAVHEADASA